MTEEQQRALALARARQRAAQAQQVARQQETIQQRQPAPTPQQPSAGGTNILEQSLNGANEGVASLIGFPVDAATSALNAGVRGVNNLAGTELSEIQNPIGGSASVQQLLRGTGSITDAEPQTAGQRYARRIGQEAGFGAPIALATGGAYGAGSVGRVVANNFFADAASGVAGQTAREIAPQSAFADVLASTVAGGGVSAIRGNRMRSRPDAPHSSTEEMFEAASQAYERSNEAGVHLNRASQEALFDQLQARLKNERASPRRHPRAFDAVEEAKSFPNARLADIEETRSIIGRDVASNKDEAGVGVALKSEIDDFLNSVTPSQTVGGDPVEAIAELQKGRKLSHQAHKAETIENQIFRGETGAASSGTGGNQVNSIRQKVRTVLDNEVAPRRSGTRQGFTPDEIAQMERIVRGSKGQNALRSASRLAPSAGALPSALALAQTGAAGLGAASTGNPWLAGVAALPVAAEGAKTLAEKLSKRDVDELLDIIRRGGQVVPKQVTDTGRAVQATGGLGGLGGLQQE